MKKHLILIILFFSVVVYSQTTPGDYTIENVKINTKDSDFGTAFFGKGKVVFAAPKDGLTINKKIWADNQQAFLDLYIGEINEKGEIVNKQKMPGEINTKYHEGVVSFTKDMKTVYFSANNYIKKKKQRTDSTEPIQRAQIIFKFLNQPSMKTVIGVIRNYYLLTAQYFLQAILL